MRKRLIDSAGLGPAQTVMDWKDLSELAEVELTSEDRAYPIESALLQDGGVGWRAGAPGPQVIRLLFDLPQRISAIQLAFVESTVERTQEYQLRWSSDGGNTFHEIVRQQWNFSPSGETTETETHHVKLPDVTVLELAIKPDIGNQDRIATLRRLRVA